MFVLGGKPWFTFYMRIPGQCERYDVAQTLVITRALGEKMFFNGLLRGSY